MHSSYLPSQKEMGEARLFLGLNNDKTAIVGTLDRVGLKPIVLKSAIQAGETVTSLKYDPDRGAIVYYGENARRSNGSPDYIRSGDILSGANISDLSGVGDFVDGGLAYTRKSDESTSQMQVISRIPSPIEVNESSTGFVAYVPTPNDGESHYRTISPSVNGESDTVLIGHPDGSVEFSNPVQSPLLVPLDSLTNSGAFSGTPNVASGTWRYQLMGTSQVVSNTSGSVIEVELSLRYSISAAGSRAGMYASLVNGGADYATNFVEGVSNIKHDGGAGANAGGNARWRVVLSPGQKCQFTFGAWTNATGSMVATLGSLDETAGTSKQTVYQPVITLRRVI